MFIQINQMKIKIILLTLVLVFTSEYGFSQKSQNLIKLARVKYSGGGDWYNDPSGEVNLLKFVAQNTNAKVDPVYEFVDLTTDKIFTYPMLFLTGHGNVNLTDVEVKNLKSYLEGGGFLYIDDDYGFDKFINKELKKVFPNQELVEIPFTHPIFHIKYDFPNGVPKLHEHDDKQPKTYGLFLNGRLCLVYTVESNPSDGWVDAEVHSDSAEKRLKSLQFGANIILYALTY